MKNFRGTAITMKKMLETQFPGIDVILDNYPPPFPKRLLSKVVPVFQFGVIWIIMVDKQIFPMIGIMMPLPWYYSFHGNRFGSIVTAWLLGNVMQSFLQSSGAFEVFCNGELVFSKLKQRKFAGEIELKDLVGKTLANTRHSIRFLQAQVSILQSMPITSSFSFTQHVINTTLLGWED
ncbi:hypothetical protein GQ457_05G017980 [Hibiscus cannabinus]